MLFFNQDMQMIPQVSSVTQVNANQVNGNGWTTLTPTGGYAGAPICCTMPEPGYIVIYVDNQSIGKDVWFDNLMVGHYKGKVQEESHYYPYGLTLQTDVQVPEVTKQVYKYQGIELEKSFGLEMYETENRMLDGQLGIFRQQDKLAEKFPWQSPYASMDNNPANNTDPDGTFSRFGAWWRNIVWGGDGTTRNEKTGESGVNYNYVDVNGEAQTSIIYNGDKPKTLDEAQEEAKGIIEDYTTAENNHAIHKNEDGQEVRTVDGQPLDAPMSGPTQAKVVLGMIDPALLSYSPINVTKAVNAAKEGKELFKFGGSADRHMADPNRAVPVQILEQAIKNSKGVADPKGSRALMHITEMWKNGKAYNLEVLYDKTTNTIWHFKYWSK